MSSSDLQNPIKDAINEISKMTETSLDKIIDKIRSKNDSATKNAIKKFKFVIEKGTLSNEAKIKLINVFIQVIVDNTLGNDNILIFPLLERLLSSGIARDKLTIEWKPLYNVLYDQMLSHSKVTQKNYPTNYFLLFLSVIAKCTNYFSDSSVDEIIGLLLSSLKVSDPQMPASLGLLCSFLPPLQVEKWMKEILDIYVLFNHQMMDLLVLPLLIRTFEVCKDYDISSYVPLLFNKLATIRTNDLSFVSEIEQFCYEEDSKKLFAKLFALLLTTKAQDIVIVNLQKYMTIIESDLTNFSFIEYIIDFYSEFHNDSEIDQCFIAIILPIYIHCIYTPSFNCANLSKLVALEPSITITPLLNTIQSSKDKISIINCLKEIAPIVGKTKESIDAYLLQLTSLLDSISSVEEDYTILILQTYEAFTRYYKVDESLMDWVTGLFSVLVENAQVAEYDHDVLVLTRQVLLNIVSSLDISVMWTLLDMFGDCLDNFVGMNVMPFADSLPINSYADLCLSEVNLQNAVVIHRILKSNESINEITPYIVSAINHGDAPVREIGRKIIEQVIKNSVKTYPRVQLDNGVVQWNKPTGDLEIVNKIYDSIFGSIKANFNGKDFQTQIDFLETAKTLLKSVLFDKSKSLEIVKWLVSIQYNVLHSSVICKIIECLLVPFSTKSKNYKPMNVYQEARMEQAALDDFIMKCNEDIVAVVSNYLLEVINFQNSNVQKMALHLANCIAQVSHTFMNQFPHVLELLKEKKTKPLAELSMVFVENCDIQEQFKEVVDFTLIITEMEDDLSEVKNNFITFLDSIDFYTEAHDTDAIYAERQRLAHSSIAIYNEKKAANIQNFVIAIVCALLDGRRPVISREIFEFANQSLFSEDITVRRLSFEVFTSATERMIPRVEHAPEKKMFKLNENKFSSLYLTKEQQLSVEEMGKYFPDPENRVDISKFMYDFITQDNILNHDEDSCFSHENYNFFTAMCRFFGHVFNEKIIDKSYQLLEGQTFEGISFANEGLCSVISTLNFTKDEASKEKILSIISKYSAYLVLSNDVFSNKDPSHFKWIADYILSKEEVTTDIVSFSIPFIMRNADLRKFIIDHLPLDKSLIQIYHEIALCEAESVFNKLLINPKILITFIASVFNDQNPASAALHPICASHIDLFFKALEDDEENESNEDDFQDCVSNALEGIATKFSSEIVPYLSSQSKTWSSQLSVFDVITEVFNSSVFVVDDFVNDIILDSVIPSMMSPEKEVHNKAQRLLSLAFCRFNILKENVDLFIGVFGKMMMEKGGSNAGILGLTAIIEATPIFGEVSPALIDALGVLSDVSSSNPQVKDFLADFWRKYEGSFTSSAALALSPFKHSLIDDIE